MRISTRHVLSDISIHALRVEGDWCAQWNDVCEYISIHALRVEGDYMLTGTDDTAENFYPRPPGGGRQHAPPSNVLTNCISIHALRVEGDQQHFFLLVRLVDFYPRPPGGGRLKVSTVKAPHTYIFLSTPSGWRATSTVREILHNVHTFLSTPSGWRAT